MAIAIERKWWRRPWLSSIVVSLFIASGVYLGISYIQRLVGTDSPVTPPALSYSTDPTQANEAEVDSDLIRSHRANPEDPRVLRVPSLGIESRAFPMGIARDGSIQTPQSIYDTGWYTGAGKPGKNGAVFIDGHVSGPTKPGVFKNLGSMKVGDTLELETGDTTTYRYAVVHTENISYRSVDMKKVLRPYGAATQGLNLMTCSGRYNKAAHSFENRTIVYAKLID